MTDRDDLSTAPEPVAPADPPPDVAPSEGTTSTADEAAAATTTDGTAPAAEGNAPRFVPVEVVNVDFYLASPSPILQLRESDPPYRRLEFPIGLPEAQAIAFAIDKVRAPRPTTPELLAAVASAAGAELVALRLTGASGGTMLAELELMTSRGRAVVDCRPSDGVGFALRQPGGGVILCEEGLLD